jgi:hypothetical protein
LFSALLALLDNFNRSFGVNSFAGIAILETETER